MSFILKKLDAALVSLLGRGFARWRCCARSELQPVSSWCVSSSQKLQDVKTQASGFLGREKPRPAGGVGPTGPFKGRRNREAVCALASGAARQDPVCRVQRLVPRSWCPRCLPFRGFCCWTCSRLAAWARCPFVLKLLVCVLQLGPTWKEPSSAPAGLLHGTLSVGKVRKFAWYVLGMLLSTSVLRNWGRCALWEMAYAGFYLLALPSKAEPCQKWALWQITWLLRYSQA